MSRNHNYSEKESNSLNRNLLGKKRNEDDSKENDIQNLEKRSTSEDMNENKENYIIGKINIHYPFSEDKIINSYENMKREQNKLDDIITEKENEEEIQNCEIYINNEKIDFNYSYNFEKVGIYTIKYVFKTPLTSANSLFAYCYTIIHYIPSISNTNKIIISHFYIKVINNYIH